MDLLFFQQLEELCDLQEPGEMVRKMSMKLFKHYIFIYLKKNIAAFVPSKVLWVWRLVDLLDLAVPGRLECSEPGLRHLEPVLLAAGARCTLRNPRLLISPLLDCQVTLWRRDRISGGKSLKVVRVVSYSRSVAADLVGVVVVALLGQEDHCLVLHDAGLGPGAAYSILSYYVRTYKVQTKACCNCVI